MIGDSWGVYFIDYLARDKTINGQYYTLLLDVLEAAIEEKRPHLVKKKIIFYQDNARVHTCKVSISKLKEMTFVLFPHPPYSLDLDPSASFLFPNFEKFSEEKNLS